jgi:hypothetical protein
VKEVMDVKEVKEVEEAEEAEAIARRSFLLTCLARIAVYSAAATRRNPSEGFFARDRRSE